MYQKNTDERTSHCLNHSAEQGEISHLSLISKVRSFDDQDGNYSFPSDSINQKRDGTKTLTTSQARQMAKEAKQLLSLSNQNIIDREKLSDQRSVKSYEIEKEKTLQNQQVTKNITDNNNKERYQGSFSPDNGLVQGILQQKENNINFQEDTRYTSYERINESSIQDEDDINSLHNETSSARQKEALSPKPIVIYEDENQHSPRERLSTHEDSKGLNDLTNSKQEESFAQYETLRNSLTKQSEEEQRSCHLSFLSHQKALSSTFENSLMDPGKINLVGGHINQIRIENEQTIVKKTAYNEVQQYALIFDDSLEAQGIKLKQKEEEKVSNRDFEETVVFEPNVNKGNQSLKDLLIFLQQQAEGSFEMQSSLQYYEPDSQRQAKFYNQNIEFRSFIPKLIGIERRIKKQDENKPHEIQPTQYEYYLKLENLMQGRENASIIDLKMGTNTITFNINKPDRLKKRLLKDQMTTSKKLGLKVIGYVIKSRQKDIEEKFYKWPYKTQQEIPEVLRRIFSWPKSDEPVVDSLLGPSGQVNKEAKDQILQELRRLCDFLENRSQRDIKGASILILIDHFSRSYALKMIDLSTIRIYDDDYQRDEGLIKGVRTLMMFIQSLS